MAKQQAQAQANLDRDVKKALLADNLRTRSRQKANVGDTVQSENFNPDDIINAL